ncbi:MAG: AbgT family transporter [Deltaproteobacteria bacterium]|nr:AbgT family transporter [Deltaproteobacteria bacterium]
MADPKHERAAGWLGVLERLGNRLPDPATLFLLGALLVVGVAHWAASAGWSVEKTVAQDGELVNVALSARSLLTADGIFWALRNLVKNFVQFPPLGVVLVGMLGIGVAERSGFIGAALKTVMLAVPSWLLAPTLMFVGVLSSMGIDAGYVVLPPVAAALYKAVGRSPLVGLATVFAGVSAGFSANLFVTSLDPMLAEFTTSAAQLRDPAYQVAATSNWWFMIASTVLLTFVGWGVTSLWVEPRWSDRPPEEGGPTPVDTSDLESQRLTPEQRRGLWAAMIALAVSLAVMVVATVVPGAPLHVAPGEPARWIPVIVPLLFFAFLIPGIAYGVAVREVRSDRDVARMMGETMAGMGPYLVLSFFAAQFIAWFRYTGLGEMLAIAGGDRLVEAALPNSGLMVAFVFVVAVGNLFIGSMSAKYAFFAPVFVPMFMAVGISPELTQVTYRVGDSVSNVITPLNPYMVILLVFMRRYAPEGGLGTLVALMLPYALVFTVAWVIMLVVWMGLGLELGPAGPLEYLPAP